MRFPHVFATSLRKVSIFHWLGSGEPEHVRAETYSMSFEESNAATRGMYRQDISIHWLVPFVTMMMVPAQ